MENIKSKTEQHAPGNLTSYATLYAGSFDLFQYFQLGFSLPTFHCGNKVDQPNNLIFCVFLQRQEVFQIHDVR